MPAEVYSKLAASALSPDRKHVVYVHNNCHRHHTVLIQTQETRVSSTGRLETKKSTR